MSISTAQARASYPEFITDPTKPRCNFSAAVPVVFPAGGDAAYPAGRVTLLVHPATRQIWRAVAAIMLHYGYRFEETAGGTLACRRITGGTGTTLHAHGVAGDWNPSRNRYRLTAGGGLIQWGKQTDMPRPMVRAIEAIAMTNGRHPMEWGGRWTNIKDPMHYQIDVLQSQIAPVNLATLPAGAWTAYLAFEGGAPPERTDMQLPLQYGDGYNPAPADADKSIRGTDRSHKIEDVRGLQDRLNKLGADLTLDGIYGPDTIAAVRDIPIATTGVPWTGSTAGKEGRWWGGNQDGELDLEIAKKAARDVTAGGVEVVDSTARSAARSAQTAADAAGASAARANKTLDKIRSE